MLKLNDGPAEGSYMVKRAPRWLRAVVTVGGKKDVLDQLNDSPTAAEKVYVYERVGEAHSVHLNMADRRKSGFYVSAEYVHIPEVDGETVRDNNEWHAWCAIENNTEEKYARLAALRESQEGAG